MALGGVQMVTVFAFAINNFKRSEEEVDALMALAKARLLELYQHGEVISRYSVRVRVVGKKELLPADVQEAIMTLEKATCHNTGAVLNICMPYSSQDEMCQAYASCVDVDQLGECTPPITRKDLDDKLLVSPNVPVDLLIRTSKVHRLSDFLLWQCNEHTQLHFVDQYWPMFGAKELIPILLQYQRCKIMGY
ncbi:ditrans,polycis-polyprenyl diphosphate synthase [(2E,6E)-farnesydiphosphate specific] [Malassezia vespertilionis]|uniref:Alkyl transferase n=1 Tax=Malassezia vespertilionis TaxID=2020962 RepID=A0A2N1JFV5_9BASI|nr:ditrans,polycis-polyprenyl diphosphate synthase [(2E,6E)-farnesydiphosphate specific] [Malassezia vespertilionis]PKI85427.1 Rer2p [Malassezia vespertilionis]WFD05159.1 ditrans,polycis-polyprenyl diphosphate synthase [(2E,6E)-farnesydiphosphate specific] [Malassezia vespertilionis]